MPTISDFIPVDEDNGVGVEAKLFQFIKAFAKTVVRPGCGSVVTY